MRKAFVAALGLGLGMFCVGASAEIAEIREDEEAGEELLWTEVEFIPDGVEHEEEEVSEPREESIFDPEEEEEVAEEPREEHEEPGDPPRGDEVDDPEEGEIEASPAPEPGTWALMILGLGFLGLCARKRRQGRPA
jgi:hypothetical protein